MLICLLCDSSIVATCPSTPAVLFVLCLCFIRFCCLGFRDCCPSEPKQNQGQGLVDHKLFKSPNALVISFLAVPMRLFCFGSLVTLDVACCYLLFLLFDINVEIGKIDVDC